MFNMRVIHHQIKEDYTPITTCMRCYKHAYHYTNQCSKHKGYSICSECGADGHTWFKCLNTTKKCINCTGPHRTLAYICPIRKAALEKAKQERKTIKTKTFSNAITASTLTSKIL